MKRDNRNSRPSSGRGDRRSGGNRFNNRGFNDREKFETVCSACGEMCLVPFKPSGNKPVYCDNCFSSNKNRDNNRDRHQNFDRKNFDNQELKTINSKLDKILEIISITSKIETETKEIKPKKEVTKKTAVKEEKTTNKTIKKTAKKSTKKK